MVTCRGSGSLIDGSLPNLRNVWAGNVAEVLFGEVHLAQVVSVRPLRDEGRVAKRAFYRAVPARGPRGICRLVHRPREGEDGARVRHRRPGG